MSPSKALLCLSVVCLALGVVLASATPGYAQLGAVTKTDNVNGSVQPGDRITYTVHIPNSGTKQVKNVVFSDFPDPFTRLVNGSVTTTHGVVTVGNGGGDSHVIVEVGTLNAGETAVINFQVDVLPDVLQTPCNCAIELHNQGFVNSDLGSEPTCDDAPDDDDCVTDTPVEPAPPELEANKTCALQTDADGGGQLSQGDTLRYTITIPNVGPTPTEAVFSDNLDPNTQLVTGSVVTSKGTVLAGNHAGNTHVLVNLGTLQPGQSATIRFDVIVNANVAHVTNQGFVDFSGNTIPTDDPGTGAGQDPTVCTVFPTASPQMDSFKSVSILNDVDGNGGASPGDVLQYTITIHNTGAVAITGVTFSDAPDPQTRLVTGTVSTSQGTVTMGNGVPHTSVAVSVGTLNPGQSVTIRFNVTVNAGATGTVANQGIVSSPPTGPTPTDNPDTPPPDDSTDIPVTPKGVPDFGLPIKEVSLSLDADGNGAASPDDVLRYTVRIPNVGTGVARDVVFTDSPDPNTTLIVGSVTTTKGTVVSGNRPGDTRVVVNVGSLNPGETAVITFAVTINAGTMTRVCNQGTVTPGPIPTDDPNTSTPGDCTATPVTPKGPPIRPTKLALLQVDADGSGRPSVGDTLRYTIRIPNVSAAAVSGVFFEDTLDPNTTLIPGHVVTSKGTVVTGNRPGDASIRVDIGVIEPHEVVTISFDATINLGATRVVNQGYIDAPSIDRVPTDNPETPEPDDATPTSVTPTPLAACEIEMIWRLSGAAMIVEFSDQSLGRGTDIVDWVWDFGDGQTCSSSNLAGCSAVFGNDKVEGTLQRPVHIFTGVGRFVVKLTVVDRTGNAHTSACAFSFGDPAITEVLDADADLLLDDDEIRAAIDYWVTGKPVPNTGGKVIDDRMIKVLINLWIKGEPISQAQVVQ